MTWRFFCVHTECFVHKKVAGLNEMLKKWQDQRETGAYPSKRRLQGSPQCFPTSLVSPHHFPSISARENNNWVSLPEQFQGPSLPTAFENRLTWLPDCIHALNLEKPLWSFIQTHWAFIKGCNLTHDPLAYIITIPLQPVPYLSHLPQKPPTPPPRWCSPHYTLQDN